MIKIECCSLGAGDESKLLCHYLDGRDVTISIVVINNVNTVNNSQYLFWLDQRAQKTDQ